jgi:ribosomal-protein-alanine N-acetyltransferase
MIEPHLRIELAARRHSRVIAELSRTAIEQGLRWSWKPERIAAAIASSDTNVVVALERGNFAGFGIMKYEEALAHLVLFAVRPSRRRRGVGTALLHWLEEVATVAGVAWVRIEAREENHAALAFYARHGYERKARAPGLYGGQVDGVLLHKALRPAVTPDVSLRSLELANACVRRLRGLA